MVGTYPMPDIVAMLLFFAVVLVILFDRNTPRHP